MREIEDCDYRAQEIKGLELQLNLAKQERDEAISKLQEYKAKIEEINKWCSLHSQHTLLTRHDRYCEGFRENAEIVLEILS